MIFAGVPAIFFASRRRIFFEARSKGEEYRPKTTMNI